MGSALKAEVQSALRDSLSIAEREVKRRYSGPTGDATLSVRSGALRAAARGREIQGGPPPVPVIGRFFPEPVLKYAHVHEIGMVIRPRRGKYLKFRVGGKFVQVAQVRIPARPVWAESAKTIAPAVNARFAEAIERMVRTVG